MSAITIPDAMIRNRRTAYACCAADAGYALMTALKYGDKSASLWQHKLDWLLWARDAMMRTPLSTETGKCFDHDDACLVIQKADAICSKGCNCCTEPTPAPPVNCDITPDYTVQMSIDAALYNAVTTSISTEGYAFYVSSDIGGGGSAAGRIYTYTSGTWVSTTLNTYDIVLSEDTGLYWINYAFPSTPALYFPPIDMDNDGAGTYELVSRYPWASTGSRSVAVEVSEDGNTWVPAGTFQENQLVIPYQFGAPGTDYQYIRSTYTDLTCVYQYFDGNVTLQPNPPLSGRSLQMGKGSSAIVGTVYTSDSPMPGQTGQTSYLDFYAEQNWTWSVRFQLVRPDPLNASLPTINMIDSRTVAGVDTAFVNFVLDGNPITEQIRIYGVIYPTPNLPNGFVIDFNYPMPTIADGDWHTAEIVREGSTFSDWSINSGLKLYVDGALVSMTNGSSYMPDPYILADLDNDARTVRYTGGGAGGNLCRIDEIYTCKTSRTAGDVSSVLQPNLMQGNDGLWQRDTWHRVEATDQNGLVNNFGPGISLVNRTISIFDPSTLLSTDVDPSI